MKKMIFFFGVFMVFAAIHAQAEPVSGEAQYRILSEAAAKGTDSSLFENLAAKAAGLSWDGAAADEFEGNLRVIDAAGKDGIYFIRKLTGEIMILAVPGEKDPLYANLKSMTENRMIFRVQVINGTVNGQEFAFARFAGAPTQPAFDRIFKITSVLMLFLIMVGMGMTLTVGDFSLVIRKPRGILVGLALQYGVMPLAALGLGHLFGYYQSYPYIFIGLLLVTAIPAGVTSNLLTHFAKGDLALSISLTSLSTILSILFTPLLLTVYGAGVSGVAVPVRLIAQTIIVLVIVPLALGMAFRAKWKSAAEKASKFFSALGIVTVLFIMIAGVASNLHVFSDTERYGVSFYFVIFLLSLAGIALGVIVAKIVGLSNYQTKSVSLETGIRNSVLGMTIALIIQDKIGDFFSSIFIVAGIYGLVMYVSGIIAIIAYKRILPSTGEEDVAVK